MSPEEEAYVKELENAYTKAVTSSGSNSGGYASTNMYNTQNKQNLIEWQLDFSNELIDIQRLLRCDVLMIDDKGVERWVPNPNPDRVVFNDLGVNDIVRQIKMFLNKNTVLSYYRIEDIIVRVKIIGHEIRALIYNNYELYGMDNEYKQNNYRVMVLDIVTMIESAYRRALNGEERRDLNQARVVQQQDNPMQQMPNVNVYNSSQQKRGFSKVFPWNWGK